MALRTLPGQAYWHDLPPRVQERLFEVSFSEAEFRATYQPPPWCRVGPVALHPLGCWSLLGGLIRQHRDCEGCEYQAPFENRFAS